MFSIVPTAAITKYNNRSARTEIGTASSESQILKDHIGVPNCERPQANPKFWNDTQAILRF